MGLFDFLKKKKKTGAAGREESEGGEELSVILPPETEPPETRYTQEYQDFLAALEEDERAGEESEDPADEG